MPKKLMWQAIGALAGAVAGALTRRLLTSAWQRSRGRKPPTNPASPQTTWSEAVIYTVASGVAIAVARLLAQRGAAAAWEKATGSRPPGLEEVAP
ncbi:MAG: DUF4235 domain-containing protein [Acidimicrobiales bacterium]